MEQDPLDALRRAYSGRCLAASGDLLSTGATGTNVGDLLIGLRGSAYTRAARAA
jgi:glycerate-2-kinase